MTHKQYPIGTPFTPASTAKDVLAGINLAGRNAIVPVATPASASKSPARSPGLAHRSRSPRATPAAPPTPSPASSASKSPGSTSSTPDRSRTSRSAGSAAPVRFTS